MSRTGARAAGRLVSLNVGGPREVPWEGKTVRTAIWKEPVDGPRMVRRINIDGDDQADRAAHGGEHRAVYVYQLESYRYWEEQLGRSDFAYGQFGENFTVEGLADDEVCIGDRYRIGGATFEVTQPRVTCFRLGIRMDEARMPSLLVAHHRPGFYLRVLEEGQVQAGDEIVRLQDGPEQLSVADVDGLLYLPNRSRRMLERALLIPALSEGWKGSFRTLARTGRTSGRSAAARLAGVPTAHGHGDPAGEQHDRLVHAHSGRSGFPGPGRREPGAVPHGPPAHARTAISLRSSAATRSRRSRVATDIASASSTSHTGSGAPSCTSTSASATRSRRPRRAAPSPCATASDRSSCSVPASARPRSWRCSTPSPGAKTTREVWWVHGRPRRRRARLRRARSTGCWRCCPHAHRIVSYSRPGPGETPGPAFDLVGRLSIETIAGAGIPVDADYYLCGPDAFMQSVSAALIARGTVPEHVAMEVFGAKAVIVAPGLEGEHPPPHAPAGPPGAGPPVTFGRSNLTLPWDPGYGNLLEFAEACDIPVSFGCRIGVCHYCETGLLTGKVAYNTEPLEPPDGEHVLLCCSRPTGEDHRLETSERRCAPPT